MEKLKLEHLAPYLPYGAMFQSSMDKPFDEFGKQPIWHIEGISKLFGNYCLITKNNNDAYDIATCRLVLRPLSTICLKWFHENIDEDIEDFIINCEPENNHFSVEVCDKVLGWSALSYEEYQLIFNHHFDVFGLIDKGLAIDINTTK